MAVTLSNQGLVVDGQHVPVYSGSVHYWRLERALWPKILDQVIELGFGMVETYIPWSTHEIEPGVYDWGSIDDRKDVEAFMRLCEEKGLWLMVRPGPLINAELTDFGFPAWVLDDPAVQSRTASGSVHYDAAWGLHPPKPFPVPSYASEVFYDAVGGWFDQVMPIINRHLAPGGCIVAVQSDNETCYLFHDQPYATDYSDASLALYRQFLSERYSSIHELNAEYRTDHPAFADVEPPRDCGVAGAADLPLHLDWVAYKEHQIRWSVARIARMMRERGLQGVPVFHDIAWQIVTPLDVGRMESDPDIDWVGMNLYCNQDDYRTVARRMRFLAGVTKLPFVPEFGCGLWSHHHRTFLPEEHEFVTLSALMNGLKAINFYMLVERDRWQGSPIDRHGEYRDDYADFYHRLSAFLRRYPLWEYERDASAMLMLGFDISRHARMMTTLNVAHADLLGLPKELFDIEPDLGLRWDPRFESDYNRSDNWIGQAAESLKRRGIAYDLGDTHVDPKRLDQYDTIYLQTIDFMDPADQEALLGYVEDGGRLVIGPGMPKLDPRLRQSELMARFLSEPGRTDMGRGELVWSETEQLRDVVDSLDGHAQFRLEDSPVELSILRRNEDTLLFLANPTSEASEAVVRFDGEHRFESVWSVNSAVESKDELAVAIEGYSVRVFDVTPPAEARGAR
ncbi:MAG: beta-galactosidase [Thermomicrobiales bacterium]|nr:beta-galactosidase [Thermomicrobiales bacterium]